MLCNLSIFPAIYTKYFDYAFIMHLPDHQRGLAHIFVYAPDDFLPFCLFSRFFLPQLSFCQRGVLKFLPKSPPFQLPGFSFCDTYNHFHYANDLDAGFSRVAWRSCKWLHTKQPLFVLFQLRIPRCIIKSKQKGKTRPPNRHLPTSFPT